MVVILDSDVDTPDVGCGPGAVLALLAQAVGTEGQVVGLDSDESAVAAASALIASTGLPNASFMVGKADDTGLPEAGFDVVMMRHVLAHNGGAEQRIVDHLATLVRPGGALYLLDAHLKAIAMYPEPAGLQDLFDRYQEFLAAKGSDLRIGLRRATWSRPPDSSSRISGGGFPSWRRRRAGRPGGAGSDACGRRHR